MFALLLFAFSLPLSSHVSADVIVISNSSVSDSSISAADLEKIFLGKKRSLSSGTKVKAVVLKSGAAHEQFLSTYVNKSAGQYSAYWKRKIVEGTGIPPKSFASESDLIAYIKNNANTIGYLSSEADTLGLNVISVN